MMKVPILCIFLIGVISISICNAAPLNSNEQEAKAFVQRESSKLFNYFDKITQELIQTKDDADPEQMLGALKTILETAKLLADVVKEAKKFDVSKFTDPELKYIFKMIGKSANEAVLGDKKLVQMFMSLGMLEELASDKDIPSYRNEKIHLAYFPDIQDIFVKSNDSEELKYYWTTWRDKNGAWASTNLVRFINNTIEAAGINEITPLELWIGEYNITEMENVMTQIEPFYNQLHGFIRKQLHKKYGDLINLNGPIPHHLFEQVLAQAWTPGSIIDEMYPHNDLLPYDEILKKNKYNALKMFKMADQFYQSLGLGPIPDEYWGVNIKMNSAEDEGDCKPLIFDLSPNVYLQFCQKMDFRKFLQAHGYMGEVYYAREKVNLPAYYFDAYDLQFPVGESVVLSASTPKHLSTIGLTSDIKFTEEVKMNRLLRMGIHTLLNVPVHFVHTKVMADLFSGAFHITDLNKNYWKMMDKYVGVEPPADRGVEAFDFPFKFYYELQESKQASKFMREILGYQFYEKLCEISGQYSKSVESEPMNNCDFYGSKKAGDALKKMMRLGSSKSMREVLATILPDNPSVNAESLIEYYAPMQTWLIKKNREDSAIVGWTHSDKKVSAVKLYPTE